MDTITTTQHLGQAPGRGRSFASVVCAGWRQHTVAPAVHGGATTAGFPMYASFGNITLGNTTTLAGAPNEAFTKRHARHLGRGST